MCTVIFLNFFFKEELENVLFPVPSPTGDFLKAYLFKKEISKLFVLILGGLQGIGTFF